MRIGASPTPVYDFDAVIVGAGVSGLYQLYRLREAGLNAHIFEAGSDVGGTWYWNRYPGARFDSESFSYGYSFSPELLAEWEWSEFFATQPETYRYLRHVADRFELRPDISFDTRVVRALYDHTRRGWQVEFEHGGSVSAQFLIAAVGVLSIPNIPCLPGAESFTGLAFHTTDWPPEPFDVTGLKVGIIGTGATGVQVIQELSKTAERLTVFQRTPNWCAPLHNRSITASEQEHIRADYQKIFDRCRSTFAGFIHDADRRKALDVSPEERERFYEELYSKPGFGLWVGNFRDVLVSEQANATISEFMARKIRDRVRDVTTAARLTPTDHGFGTRRVPLESGYYEVYNQDNVELVDLRETPIDCVTASGLRTTAGEYDLDVIIYATGFDAVTGAFDRIDIKGRDGMELRQAWADGPRTYLGLQVSGFPNLFAIVGPQNSTTFCNMPRCIEINVDWITALISHMSFEGIGSVEASAAAEEEWVAEIRQGAQRMLYSRVSSWFTGRNRPGAQNERSVEFLYTGGLPAYIDRCNSVAHAGYEGFIFDK